MLISGYRQITFDLIHSFHSFANNAYGKFRYKLIELEEELEWF